MSSARFSSSFGRTASDESSEGRSVIRKERKRSGQRHLGRRQQQHDRPPLHQRQNLEDYRVEEWQGLAALNAEEVLQTVQSSYVDKATPTSSLLQWRLQIASGEKVILQQLRDLAYESPGLVLMHGKGRKGVSFTVYLKSEPSDFKGFLDDLSLLPDSTIPSDLATEATSHLSLGGWPHADNPCHEKYAITDWLRECSQTLAAAPWGQVLGIVRLFMSGSTQVLGKRNGRMTPYFLSEEYEKQENARIFRPTGLRPGERFVETWAELLSCLESLLRDRGGRLRLSDLKQTFRKTWGQELTETALGHTTLLKLVQDYRCAGAFSLEKEGEDELWLCCADHSAEGAECQGEANEDEVDVEASEGEMRVCTTSCADAASDAPESCGKFASALKHVRIDQPMSAAALEDRACAAKFQATCTASRSQPCSESPRTPPSKQTLEQQPQDSQDPLPGTPSTAQKSPMGASRLAPAHLTASGFDPSCPALPAPFIVVVPCPVLVWPAPVWPGDALPWPDPLWPQWPEAP